MTAAQRWGNEVEAKKEIGKMKEEIEGLLRV